MSPQTQSNIRTVVKLIGMGLATHGATKAAALINSEDSVGLILIACGWLCSHFGNSAEAILAKADKIVAQRISDAGK